MPILTEYLDLYSFKNLPKTGANSRLRSVAFRTFVGACCTLTSSIVYAACYVHIRSWKLTTHSSNLTILMVLNGEPGWVCLMCCNSDGMSDSPNAYKVRTNQAQFSSLLSLFNGSPPVTMPAPLASPPRLQWTIVTSADDHQWSIS